MLLQLNVLGTEDAIGQIEPFMIAAQKSFS
jgi:hypothetical protein